MSRMQTSPYADDREPEGEPSRTRLLLAQDRDLADLMSATASIRSAKAEMGQSGEDDDLLSAVRMERTARAQMTMQNPKASPPERFSAGLYVALNSAKEAREVEKQDAQVAKSAWDAHDIAMRITQLHQRFKGDENKTSAQLAKEGWDKSLITPDLLAEIDGEIRQNAEAVQAAATDPSMTAQTGAQDVERGRANAVALTRLRRQLLMERDYGQLKGTKIEPPPPKKDEPQPSLMDRIKAAIVQGNPGDQDLSGGGETEQQKYEKTGEMPAGSVGQMLPMGAPPPLNPAVSAWRSAVKAFVATGPAAITGGQQSALTMPEGDGASGFIGEQAGGLVGGLVNPVNLPQNLMGYITGAKSVQIAAPILKKVATTAGPRVAGVLANMVEGAGDAGTMGLVQAIQEENWTENPWESVKRVAARTGASIGIGMGAGGTLSSVTGSKYEGKNSATVPELIGRPAGIGGAKDIADAAEAGEAAWNDFQLSMKRGTSLGPAFEQPGRLAALVEPTIGAAVDPATMIRETHNALVAEGAGPAEARAIASAAGSVKGLMDLAWERSPWLGEMMNNASNPAEARGVFALVAEAETARQMVQPDAVSPDAAISKVGPKPEQASPTTPEPLPEGGDPVANPLTEQGDKPGTELVGRTVEQGESVPDTAPDRVAASMREWFEKHDPEAIKRAESPKDAPESSPTEPAAATSIPDRITEVADRIEKAALERRAKRTIPRGRNVGASINPVAEVYDMAAIAAARAVKAGVKGGKALAKVVQDVIDEHAPHLKEKASAIVRATGRIVKGTLDEKGLPDPDRLEVAIGAMIEPKGARESVKSRVNAATGVRPDNPPTVSERKALASGLRKAAQAGRDAYRAGYREARAEAKVQLSDLRTKLTTEAKASNFVKDEFRRSAVELAEAHLPVEVRGKVLRAVARAKDAKGLGRVVERIETELDRFQGRDELHRAGRTIIKAVKKPDAKLLSGFIEDLTGNKPTGDVTRKMVREAMKAWTSRTRQALRSEIAADVRGALQDAVRIGRLLAERAHEFKRQNRVILEGKQVAAEGLRNQIRESVRSVKPPKFVREAGGDATKPRSRGLGGKYIQNQLNEDTLAQIMDGGDRGGIVGQVMTYPLWNGESRMHKRTFEFTDSLGEITSAAGWESLGAALAETEGTLGRASQTFVDVDLGEIKRISLGQAMDILATDKTTGGRLSNGNKIVFDERPNSPVEIGPEAMEAIRKAVGEKRLAALDSVAELFTERVTDPLFSTLRNIKGWEPERVPWYHPTKRSGAFSHDQNKFAGWSGAMTKAHLEDAGFTIERTGGDTPFVIGNYFSKVLKHAQSASAIIELAEPIRTAEMVVLHPELRPMLSEKFGDDVVKRFEERLRSASELGAYDLSADFDKWFLRLIQNTSRGMTALNKNTVLRQFGGVATMAAEMPVSAYTDGVAVLSDRKAARATYDEMIAESGLLRNRWALPPSALMTAFGAPGGAVASKAGAKASLAAAGRSLADVRPGRIKESLGDAWGNFTKVFDSIRVSSWADAQPAIVAWAGWKAEAQRLHPDWSHAQIMEFTREQAEASVRRTQNTFSVLDTSQFIKDSRHSAIKAAFVAFTGDSNKALNMLWQAGAARDGKKFATVASLRILNALWGAVVTTGVSDAIYTVSGALSGNDAGREQKDDARFQKMAVATGKELAGTLLGADKLVSMYQFADAAISPLETPAGSQIEDVASGMGKMARGVVEKVRAEYDNDPEKAEKAAKKFLHGLEDVAVGGSTLSGVPVGPAYRDAKNVKAAITAKHSDDLKAERSALRKIDEKERTPDQRRTLRRLERWYQDTYLDSREREKGLRERGHHDKADQVRDAREEKSEQFKSRAESGPVAVGP